MFPVKLCQKPKEGSIVAFQEGRWGNKMTGKHPSTFRLAEISDFDEEKEKITLKRLGLVASKASPCRVCQWTYKTEYPSLI